MYVCGLCVHVCGWMWFIGLNLSTPPPPPHPPKNANNQKNTHNVKLNKQTNKQTNGHMMTPWEQAPGDGVTRRPRLHLGLRGALCVPKQCVCCACVVSQKLECVHGHGMTRSLLIHTHTNTHKNLICLRTMDRLNHDVTALAFSHDGRLLAGG